MICHARHFVGYLKLDGGILGLFININGGITMNGVTRTQLRPATAQSLFRTHIYTPRRNAMHGDSVLLSWELWTLPPAMVTEVLLTKWEEAPHTVGEA